MRKLSKLCHALEMTGLGTVLEMWKHCCGPDYTLIEPCLRPSDDLGSTYPCPKNIFGYCPRKIVDYEDGEYSAVCQHPGKLCADLVLTRAEAHMYDVDVGAFISLIAKPLGIRWQQSVSRGDHTWSIGVSGRRTSRNQPVFFICLSDTTRFQRNCEKLLLELSGPFVILSATARHRTAEVQQHLQARGIGFISIEDDLLLDDSGQLVCPEQPDREPAMITVVADRERVVAAFIRKHSCRIKDIQEAAGVHESDYYKWRAGKLPDHYAACQDIERVLRTGLTNRA